MIKIFVFLLILSFSFAIFVVKISAEAAPQPVVSFSQKDGYTVVTVTPKKDTTVRYTTDGTRPYRNTDRRKRTGKGCCRTYQKSRRRNRSGFA